MRVTCPICKAKSRYMYQVFDHKIYKCRSCGLGFVSPLPTKDYLDKFYSTGYYADGKEYGYQTDYAELEIGLKKTYRNLLRKLELKDRKKPFSEILDVGCAYGYFLDVAAEMWPKANLVGIDITKESLVQSHKKKYSFINSSIENLSLDEHRFDLIFMGDMFEHIHDPLRTLRQISRYLTDNGVVVITTVDFDSIMARLLKTQWRLMTPPEHLWFWNRESMIRLFYKFNFSVRIENYWLYLPKSYVKQRFISQFKFKPPFLDVLPLDLVPIPSIDVMCCVATKSNLICA